MEQRRAANVVVVPQCAEGEDVVQALGNAGYEVTQAASTAEAALILAEGARPDVIVWIDSGASDRDDPAPLTKGGVPLAHVASEDMPPSQSPPHDADALIWGWTPDALDRLARELATDTVYQPALVGAIQRSVLHALEQGFGVQGEIVRRFVRSDPRLPGEVNAVVPFGGTGTRGRVVVSGPRDTIRGLLTPVVGEAKADERDQIEGFVGELANLALGEMQRYFREHDITLSMGYPLRLRGREVRLHFLADAPTLTTVVRAGSGELHVGFCLFHVHGQASWGAVSSDQPTGELTFL